MADSLDLVDFLGRLRKRWRVFAVAALAGAALGAGVSAARPRVFVAHTHILVEPPPESWGTFGMTSPSYLDSLKGYALLAEGDTVRARALESLSESHRAAAGEIRAETPTLSRVVAIRAEGRDPEAALALARAAAEQTLRLVGDGGAERLRLIDPGVTPEAPEERDIAVNALAAAFLALIAAAIFEGARAMTLPDA